ncbi:PepSY-associated TM helix domain-containing protein [Planctomicrobium sp. SH664]|uniref:PepSY-associated TM helix domain-containing protein n=1 Tax=Planctomicrobium sp. SH664 TaxID=3448125 RepID=UPI003F5B8426
MSTQILETQPAEPSTTVPVPDAAKVSKPERTPSYYRTIWRWHFYAGVLTTPLLLVVVATGAIYIYGAEIVDWVFRDAIYVQQVGPETLPPEDLVAAVENEKEAAGKKFTRIFLSADPQRAAMLTFRVPPKPGDPPPQRGRGGRGRGNQTTYYVDQYSGVVQGTTAPQEAYQRFFRGTLSLHRNLWIGTTGRLFVELATSWLVILGVTGIYLWWPKKWNDKGVWWPRLRGKTYVVLRDLHTVVGIYLTPVILLVTVTGLFYAYIWSQGFFLLNHPEMAIAAMREPARGEQQRNAGERQREEVPPPKFPLNAAVAKARELYPDRDLTVTMPTSGHPEYDVSAINDYARATWGPMQSTGLHLDPDTGEIHEESHLWDNPRYWWHTWTYPLHVGSVFGQYSKALWMVSMLVLFSMPLTGLWMWWERRPRGESGLPKRTGVPLRSGMVLLIALLSLLMPVAGASIILVLVWDWMWQTMRNRRAQPSTPGV